MNALSFSLGTIYLRFAQEFESHQQVYITIFNCFIYTIPHFIEAFGRLLTWAIIAAYQGFLVIPAVLLLMIIQYTSIETFIFGWRKETKIYDAVLIDEPSKTRQTKVNEIFTRAILSSWIAPVTPWCTSKSVKVIKEQRKMKSRSERFYMFSSSITNFYLLILILVIHVLNENQLNNFTTSTYPVTHCESRTLFSNVTWTDSKASDEVNIPFSATSYTFFFKGTFFSDPFFKERSNLLTLVNQIRQDHVLRVCNPGEESTDLFKHHVLPLVIISLLASSFFSCIISYIQLQPVSIKFDYAFIRDRYYSIFLDKVNQRPHKQIVQHYRIKTYNIYDPIVGTINGINLLHFAFLKGLFQECKELIKKGQSPFIRDQNGDCLVDLINAPSMTSKKTKHKTWLGEIFFEHLEVIKNVQGIAFISDVKKRIHWSLQFEDADQLVIAQCLLKQAVIMMERCFRVERDMVTVKELQNLKRYSNGLRDDFAELKELIRNTEKEKGARSMWNHNPPLHKAMKKRKFKQYDFLSKIGACPEAKNVYGVNPVEHQMEIFKNDLRKKKEIDFDFFWGVLVRGGTRYILESDNDLFDYILQNFPPINHKEKLSPKFAASLFVYILHPNNESKMFKMNVKYFLDIGCRLTSTKDGDGNTVLHWASQHKTARCLEDLLVIFVVQ
jgi:hypothetical protein